MFGVLNNIKKIIMEKVIRDWKVAVLVSKWYGAGWYTWSKDYEELLFHPKLVEMVESWNRNNITEEWVKENLWIKKDICLLWANWLEIEWIEQGSILMIDEYDWYESIKMNYDKDIITA